MHISKFESIFIKVLPILNGWIIVVFLSLIYIIHILMQNLQLFYFNKDESWCPSFPVVFYTFFFFWQTMSWLVFFSFGHMHKWMRLLKIISSCFCLSKECVSNCRNIPLFPCLGSSTLQWFSNLMHHLSRSTRPTWPLSTNHWFYFLAIVLFHLNPLPQISLHYWSLIASQKSPSLEEIWPWQIMMNSL